MHVDIFWQLFSSMAIIAILSLFIIANTLRNHRELSGQNLRVLFAELLAYKRELDQLTALKLDLDETYNKTPIDGPIASLRYRSESAELQMKMIYAREGFTGEDLEKRLQRYKEQSDKAWQEYNDILDKES